MYCNRIRALMILAIFVLLVCLPAAARPSLLRYEDLHKIFTSGHAETASNFFPVMAADSAITNFVLTPGERVDAHGAPSLAAKAFIITPKWIEQVEANTLLTVKVAIGSLPERATDTGKIAVTYAQQTGGAGEPIITRPAVKEPTAKGTEASGSKKPGMLDLVIATKPGGPAEDICFRIVGNGTATSIPLYIRQTGDTEISGVHFFAHLSDAKGQQLSGVSFNLAVGGRDVTQTGITIPAVGNQVLATLNVANLTAIGAFSGNLVAEHNGKMVEADVLKGERFPLPVLKIVGATDAGVMNLISRITDLRARLRIESANLTEVKDLGLFVDNLTDPNGNRISVTWTVNSQPGENARITVPGLGSVGLEIAAEIPIAGEYTGAITLIYADKRETVTLKVNRTRLQPTVSVLGLETVRGQADSIVPWIGQDNVKLWMTIQETAGQKVTLNLPQLSVLSLKGAAGNTFQGQFEGLEVKTENDQSVTQPFTVEPGEIKRLQLNIRGLREAGAYVGKLTLPAPDATAIVHDVTILLKESAWIAGLWIGLSVLASFLISMWLKSTRPRLERQRYANRLLNDLDREAKRVDELTNGRKEVTVVAEDLRRRLEDLYDDPNLGTDAKAGEALQEIDKKITCFRQLVAGCKQVYALEPPKLMARFIPDLRKISDEMLTRSLPSAQTAEDKLKQLFTEIETALKDELLQQMTNFRKDVEAQTKAAHDAATKEKLAKVILPGIDKAKGFAERLELTAASQALKEARVEYARVMAEDLRASLQELPFGFDQNAWANSKQAILDKVQAVGRETDGEQAIAIYQAAYALYLTTLVEKLLDLMRQDLKLIEEKEEKCQITTEQAKALRGTVNSLITGLDETLMKIKKGDLSTAREEYQKGRDSYKNEVQPELNKVGIMGAKLLPTIGAVLAAWGFIPEKFTEELEDRPVDRGQRERKLLRLKITMGDGIVTGIALIAAVVLGLNLLWAGNATWGGFGDYLVALLWGLSLHQVSNQGAKRVDEIIDTWRQSKAPAAGK